MNTFLLLAAVFLLFIVLDILNVKTKKWKHTAVHKLTLCVLCVLFAASAIGGSILLARNADTVKKTLYYAYTYLIDGNTEKAIEKAKKVQSPHSDLIFVLADCMQGKYAKAFIDSDDLKNSGKLNKDLLTQADKLYELTRQMTGLKDSSLTDKEAIAKTGDIANDCFALLKVSEKSEVEFLSGFQRENILDNHYYDGADSEVLTEMLLKTPDDKELLQYAVKYYNQFGDSELSKQNAKKLLDVDKSPNTLALYSDVAAQDLMDTMGMVDDENDKETADLLKQAQKAEEEAYSYEDEDPRKEESLEEAVSFREQAQGVRAHRVINWLIAQKPIFGDNSGVIDLQFSRLYAAAGEDEKAKEILVKLMKKEDSIKEESPVKEALKEIVDVYYNQEASDSDIAGAVSAIANVDAFLPNSVIGKNYSQFLNNFLKYEKVSIFVSRVDTENYPSVRVYLNVNGKKDGKEELANDFDVDDFMFSDNCVKIPKEDVKRIEDDLSNSISIALVVDGSGSMDGERIENAKLAVEACIGNMDPKTQQLSIVLYDDNGTVLTPLTNDTNDLTQGAKQISANGGTVISSGLLCGIDSLKSAQGTRAIILMTDGEDNSPETIDQAIAAAQRENIAVFTISTGGGDREYMENIAQQTGGTYMEAFTDEELVNVYMALQNYIVNNYCFEYTVKDEVSNPRLLSIGLSDYGVSSSRMYSYGGLVLTEDGCYITRSEENSVRLLYAEPAVVSEEDAALGVPVFINAEGIMEGAELYINGKKIEDANIVQDSAIAFRLKGAYEPGNLYVSVKFPDGTSQSSNSLLSVNAASEQESSGITVTLGKNENTLYAEHMEQKDEYTLILSNAILNNILRLDGSITLQSESPISEWKNHLFLENGSIYVNGSVFLDFSFNERENYGQMAFGGSSAEFFGSFYFHFDEQSIRLEASSISVRLPQFGEVYGTMSFNGETVTLDVSNSIELSEISENLNYAFNGSLFKEDIHDHASAMQMIIGNTLQNQDNTYYNTGFHVISDNLKITAGDGYLDISGNATVNGYLGNLMIDGQAAIDTNNVDSMFEITGTMNMTALSYMFDVEETVPVIIRSVGWYPDAILLKAKGLEIDTKGAADFFTSEEAKSLDGTSIIDYPLMLDKEPYGGQVSPFLKNISIKGNKIECICADNQYESGMKIYDSVKPESYVTFTNNMIVVPIKDMDELCLFGSDFGGEITGEAKISEGQIELSIQIDGHFDNCFYDIQYDGKAQLDVLLPRNAYKQSTVNVMVSYGKETLEYTAYAMGGIRAEDGFNGYLEED